MSGISKLCRDCTHFRCSAAACRRPYKSVFDLVYGAQLVRLNSPAANERNGTQTLLTGRKKCGPTGRFFEKIEPPLPPPSARGE